MLSFFAQCTLLSAAAVATVLMSASSSLQAAELQVPVSLALRGAVGEMASDFGKRTGHSVKMTAGSPGGIIAAIKAGGHADVLVLPDATLPDLEDSGLVRRGRTALAATGFGMATRDNDPVPDISTPEALKAALLAASKVIYNDPKVTPSGQLMLRIAERLGIAEEVKAKSEVATAGQNIAMLAKDKTPGSVLALSVLVEVRGHPGARLIGPLPKELQVPLPYSAVLGAKPVDEGTAIAFVQLLASPQARKAYVADGFEVEKP
jgi:molybdate transport system substrate-binding protein